MRRFSIFLSILMVLAFPALARADRPSHVVAYGETLYSIAVRYGVTMQDLANANGITTESWVYAGQTMIIPGANSAVRAPKLGSSSVSGGVYVVQAGDTLYGLARKFGVSVSEIADANNIPPNGFLYSGWQLKIPGLAPTKQQAPKQENAPAAQPAAPAQVAKATTTNENTTYIVQPGDTLNGIAARYNVSIQTLRIANNLTTLFVNSGQSLLIPSVAAASTQTTSTAPAAASSVSNDGAVRLKDVPVYKQEQTLTCEEAAAAMATRGALSEKEIVAAMPRSDNPFEGIRGETNYGIIGGLDHYGTYASGLQKGLAKLGRPSTTYYGQPYDKFKEMILENLRAGRPVIWWTTWRESYQRPQLVKDAKGIPILLTPYEHTAVIVGADAKGVTYNDSYDGSVRFTTWANHQRTSAYFNNMALVVY